MFRLVSDEWEKEVLGARRTSPKGLRIVCPFIKAGTMSRVLSAGRAGPVEVITRFDLGCFYDGVSDLEALEDLLKNGAKIRGVKALHAKLFLFGGKTAVGTSANVTDAGMLRNHEFGFVSDDPEVLRSCQDYFGALWTKAGDDLTSANLREWQKVIAHARRNGGGRSRPRLPDFGATARVITPFAAVSGERTYTNQAFLKFYGRGAERTSRDLLIADMVAESGCNWACTYPSSHRPRQVHDGDVLYMARIAAPEDLLIFGCAVGWRHRDDEDVASRAEIQARPWKKQFSN